MARNHDFGRLEMENAHLKNLLLEIGNELLMADETGAFYPSDDNKSPFMEHLAKTLNEILL